MANGFGSLYVGASGLQSAQNGLNVIANNLSNVDTEGYVRQQVIFEDRTYLDTKLRASVSKQQTGLGVAIGDVIHARDQFLDRAYRTENGRQAFYAANFEAATEVETLLNESNGSLGASFATAISDFYDAFSEFSKSPADPVNLNLIAQKADLFLTRAQGVYDGLTTYQKNINTKIRDDIDRINELGKTIYDLNWRIQQVEAGGVETAMNLRDARDQALDELSHLANISYSETYDGIVKVKLEGTDFVIESRAYEIGMKEDMITGFVMPYWDQLSDPRNGDYYRVFDVYNADPTRNTDIGEVKALLLIRGDEYADYMDIDGMSDYAYEKTIAKSIMLNTEAELDTMAHDMILAINDLLSPTVEFGDSQIAKSLGQESISVKDAFGNDLTITKDMKIFNEQIACVGNDGQMPPRELFTRVGCERYTSYYYTDPNTNEKYTIYVYNEEDPKDPSTCYTLLSTNVNAEIAEDPSLIAHRHANNGPTWMTDDIAYDLGADIYALWESSDYTLNPSDKTPCGFAEFYAKLVGELADTGSVYRTTSESLTNTKATIESNRQAVVGVSSDEELTNMIKFQNAYNASSRYMTVISEMIETLLNTA
ncbi:MAG: flagellar hook-associated protein FlgK [Lachnospiraceae bacterium]|nr:flagellar hook-associated protein FlgK [Lachnospiraceae bacterium]